MEGSIDEWDVLEQYGVDQEDFDEGKCEICHENALVTSVILTFHLWLGFDELSRADQQNLSEEAEKKNERIPSGIDRVLDPLFGSDFCATCLAKGLLATKLQLNVVNPKGHISTPIKTYCAEDAET